MSSTDLLLLLLPLLASAQTLHWGSCRTPFTQTGFKNSSFLELALNGVELGCFASLPAGTGSGSWKEKPWLLTKTSRPNSSSTSFTVSKLWVFLETAAGRLWSDAVCPPLTSCAVHLPPVVPLGPMWVLSTDYDSYSVVYSCTNVLGVFYLD
uniref:Uncharacterized protein n=1 Tax=Oryzias sinensis TaxID=183150 RepID=A0A8C8DHX1_9TELE